MLLRAVADCEARGLSSSPLGGAGESRVTAQRMGAFIRLGCGRKNEKNQYKCGAVMT